MKHENEATEIIKQLFSSIVSDFHKQLGGQFHRGGADALIFTQVRDEEDEAVRGFRIITENLDWREERSTMRTCGGQEGVVVQRQLTSGDRDKVGEPTVYKIWMDVPALAGLHLLARQFVREAGRALHQPNRTERERELFDLYLRKAVTYYEQRLKGQSSTDL